jgi:hypothetical protein
MEARIAALTKAMALAQLSCIASTTSEMLSQLFIVLLFFETP